jgi:tetratricopeptide (TPR) repeat protein/transcriptional regulator with XRE-family HTH domain
MAAAAPGPDATRVHTVADLVAELGLLRARAAGGTRKTRVSLAELAGRVGEPRSSVHAYVSGKHLPAADVLDRIVIALGANPVEQHQWSEAWFRVAASQNSPRRPEPGAGWARPVPRQLPPDIPGFHGRRDELDRLNQLRAAGPTVVISALAGGGGVGKSALAVHWAHRVAGEFPDGQLWVDLRGFDPEAPLAPDVALAGFLRALGVPGVDIPADLAERAALYRTLLAGRHVLVVLDNARDTEQIRPLLPGVPSCLVLVASRDRLAGLVARHGAHRIDLDVLPEPDALGLLRALVGDDRVNSDPAAASTLVRRCARLPLALRIAAERTIAQSAATLGDLAAELADEQRLLDLLDAGGDPRTAIRAVFSWSTRHLSERAHIAFRALGLHPGPGFDASALAALLDTDPATARAALVELAAAHLVQHARADRYGMHDLVHAWAAERAEHDETDLDRETMLARLADHYLRGADVAMDLLYPHEKDRRPAVDVSAAAPVLDDAAARVWLDNEMDAMLAIGATASPHRPEHTVALAATLRRHLETTGRYAESQRLHEHALTAARRAGDRAAQAGSLINLSAAHARAGRYEDATEHIELAVRLCRDLGDAAELARALDDLGTVHGRTGRFSDASGNFAEALALCRQVGDTDGEARALHNLGTVHGITGDYGDAETCFQDALSLCQKLGDPLGEAYAVDNLGSVYCRMARYPESIDCHRQALALRRERGDRLGTAHALDNLGTAYRAMGDNRQALDCHQQSLTVRRDIGDLGDEPHALNNLGATQLLLGEPDQATHHHELALAQCRRTGNRYEQARAHHGLGDAHRKLDDPDQAREHWLDALAIYDELGVPEAADVRDRLAELN